MIADPYSRIRYAQNQPKEGPQLPWMPQQEDQGDEMAGKMEPLVTALKQRMSRPSAPKVVMPTPGVNPGEPGIPAPNIPAFGPVAKSLGGGFGGGGDAAGGAFKSL